MVVWNKILQEIDSVNVLLQKKTITVSIGSKLIEHFRSTIINIRNETFPVLHQESVELATLLDIDPVFQEQRKRKIKKHFDYEADDENPLLLDQDRFRVAYIEAIDIITDQLKWRFEELRKISDDFEFLTGENLLLLDEEMLTKHCMDLSKKYSADLSGPELVNEVISAKKLFNSLNPNFKKMLHFDILQMLYDFDITCSYKFMETSYRIYLSIPITSASAERSFSKLKLVKTYLRSTMGQERLTSLSLLSIEHELTENIDVEKVINDFAILKARKVRF